MLKYEMVARDIQSKISRGEYRPNEQLPVMSDLCETYGVSKITIKKAMDMLVSRGLIIKRRGSGSFVKNIAVEEINPPLQDMSRQLAGFTGEYLDTGVEVSTIVHEFSVIQATPKVAGRLRVRPEDFVYYICRTRCADGVPQEIEYTYMPISVVPGLSYEDVQGSIYGYIERTLGLKVYSAHRSIRAVMPTAEELTRLKVGRDVPLLEIDQVVYLEDGRLFEYSICRHVGDRFTFFSISTN
ncbi:MAG: GntR family transcriptional regulator [Atopobiaceae bacterium]|nr:GntR family transcriptional regulator [Atopobiaceae bacterium]MCI2172875.1 GntR family transcriptional regulator [Atopobiaceae bacterium]MCI2207182.1 GntR family transcriptional regulator [Atopobiaceae bacterium]